MLNENRYYRTSNFYLASFLFAKGIEIADIDRTGGKKRLTFVFVETPEREELTHAFNFASPDSELAMTDARKMVYAIKTLKDKLYQE